MNTDQAKSISENALASLAAALESGQSDALKNYLATLARFHHYSWGNCLLIHAQKPTATHVAGFHGWLKLHRYVKKGEKGIVILAPMVGRKKSDDLTEDEQTRVFGFRTAHVFDVSQTYGEPLPEFATVKGNPDAHTPKLIEFVTLRGIALEYSTSIAPAKGMSSGGRITLLPDLEPGEHFAVLAHEIAHELLHKTERRHQTTHTIRETEAEAVSFVVCSAIGLDTNSASCDYIQLHAGDKTVLAESLHFIQETAALILEALEINGSIMAMD